MTPQEKKKHSKGFLKRQEKFLAIAAKLKPYNGKRITKNQLRGLKTKVETALKYGIIQRVKPSLKRAYYIVSIQPDYKERIHNANNQLIRLKSRNNFMNEQDRLQSKYSLIADMLLPSNGQRISVKEMTKLRTNPNTMIKYDLIKKVKQGTKHQFVIDIKIDCKGRIREQSNRVYKRHPNTRNYPFCV